MGKMRVYLLRFYIVLCVALQCFALNCRSTGGPSLEELKSVYRNCLKRQDNRSSNNSGSAEESSYNRRNQGPQGHGNNHDEWSSLGDFANHERDGNAGGDWGDAGRNGYDRNRNGDSSRSGNIMSRGDDWMKRNSDSMNRNPGNNMNKHGYQMYLNNDHVVRNGNADDYFGAEVPRSNYAPVPTQRRYKREKSSGHRSQYNPNTPWKSPNQNREDSRRGEDQSGSNENSTYRNGSDNKGCALHCFMQEFDMIGDNDMPDRHLFTQAVTKYANNEDLKEFLQEAVEECFQIVQNENTRDKCDFSKNLGLCMSEKGRANCDDWKEDLKL